MNRTPTKPVTIVGVPALEPPRPRLENWYREPLGGGEVLFGNVYNRPGFRDGAFIRTSMLRVLTATEALTLNTLYTLGRKA